MRVCWRIFRFATHSCGWPKLTNCLNPGGRTRSLRKQPVPTRRNSAGPPDPVLHFERELRVHFGDAWVNGYEPLIARMTNEGKDRHVAAAASHIQAQVIVTLNLRHFRAQDLDPWGIRALHPQAFLSGLLRSNPAAVVDTLRRQAEERGRSLDRAARIAEQNCARVRGCRTAAVVACPHGCTGVWYRSGIDVAQVPFGLSLNEVDRTDQPRH